MSEEKNTKELFGKEKSEKAFTIDLHAPWKWVGPPRMYDKQTKRQTKGYKPDKGWYLSDVSIKNISERNGSVGTTRHEEEDDHFMEPIDLTTAYNLAIQRAKEVGNGFIVQELEKLRIEHLNLLEKAISAKNHLTARGRAKSTGSKANRVSGSMKAEINVKLIWLGDNAMEVYRNLIEFFDL
jgi:hypothetical protein